MNGRYKDDPPGLHHVYLSDRELTVLAIALAKSVEPEAEPTTAHDAGRIVWEHAFAGDSWDPILGSLATMFAEITER